MKNKRGDLTGVIYLIVSIAVLAIFLLIVGYIVPQITTPLKEKIGINAQINNSLNTGINISQNTLPTIWLIVFGGLVLGIFATSFFIQTHPIFVPIYIFLMIISIIIAIPISNAYEELSNNAILSGTASQQSMIMLIMIHLPLTTFIVGLLALLLSFAKPGGESVSLA